MRMRTLARHRLDGAGWAHPYPLSPFSAIVHASGVGDGGQGTGGDGGGNAGQQGGDGGQGGTGTGTGGQDPTGQQAPNAPAQQAVDEARQQLAQDIGKALGLVTDDKPADPTQLTAQVTDLSGQLRSARVELAAYRAAGTEGANADRLLNSRGFGDKLAALDPTDEKFAEQLKKAITDEVATDPGLYRATPAGPARGGAEFNGPPTGDRKPATLNDAIAARLGR